VVEDDDHVGDGLASVGLGELFPKPPALVRLGIGPVVVRVEHEEANRAPVEAVVGFPPAEGRGNAGVLQETGQPHAVEVELVVTEGWEERGVAE